MRALRLLERLFETLPVGLEIPVLERISVAGKP
jgi:hypothetical protein